MWDPEDIYGDTHAKMMGSFEDLADEAHYLKALEVYERLCIIIKNPIQFIFSIDYIRIVCSFRQAGRVMQTPKERTGFAALGSCTDETISVQSFECT